MEIKYNISQLGVICADLFGKAERCYEFLDEKGYLDKLENMNQLGVIQHTSLKTSHTRMEYITLQLYLINFFLGRDFELNQAKDKKKKYNLGLNNDINIGNFKISGAELISIWILLFNSGHLIGTFAAEKGLLKFIRENKEIFKKFESNLPDTIRIFFRKCIQNNDIYEFHKFLIIFSLNIHYKQSKHQKNKSFINFLIKTCQIYFVSSDNKYIKLKKYLNKIRQISYLFLDSQYSGFPINFQITPFLLNLDNYIYQLLDDSSYFNVALDALNELLAHNLYYSKESFSEFNYYSDMFHNHLKNSKITVNKLKNLVISGYPLKFNYAQNKCMHTFLELNDISKLVLSNKFNIDLENRLNETLPENCRVTIENNKRFNFIIINMIFVSGNDYYHLNSVLKFIRELIILKRDSIYNDFTSFDFDKKNSILVDFIDRDFSIVFKNALLFILNQVVKSHYFVFEDSYEGMQIIAPHYKENIEIVFNSILEKDLDSYKLDEKLLIKYFAEKLFYKNSTMLISLSSIKGYLIDTDEENVEIDGLIVMYKDHKLHLYLIESKNTNKNAFGKAKKDLSVKLGKLGLEDKLVDIKQNYNPKGVYYHLII